VGAHVAQALLGSQDFRALCVEFADGQDPDMVAGQLTDLVVEGEVVRPADTEAT
jgi:hypothetical protein